jgi:hypothetical protein
VSSGIGLDQDPPESVASHIEESDEVIKSIVKNRFSKRRY